MINYIITVTYINEQGTDTHQDDLLAESWYEALQQVASQVDAWSAANGVILALHLTEA